MNERTHSLDKYALYGIIKVMHTLVEHIVSPHLTSRHADVTHERALRCKRGCCVTKHSAASIDTTRVKPSYMERSFPRNAIVDDTDRMVRRRITAGSTPSVLSIQETPLVTNAEQYVARPRTLIERLKLTLPFNPFSL